MESNSTLHSPYDSVMVLAVATAHDPNMLVANSRNDPASLIPPHVLKTFTELQLKTFFDEQRIPWGKPQDRGQKQLSCFNVYSDTICDATKFKELQGVSIWSNETKIQIYPHSLRQLVSKKVALLLGIDPEKTCTHKMRERIEAIVNAQSQTKYIIVLHPVAIAVGKKKHTLWAISTGQHDAPQVTSLLKSAKPPMLSFMFFDQGRRRDLPNKIAEHKKLLSRTRTLTIDNLPADKVDALRWLFHAGTKLPGQIGRDVIDITDTAEQGGYVVKYVHYSDKQTQILKDVLTTQLQICAQTMTQSAQLGQVWLPPTLRSAEQAITARAAHTGDSDGEDSGHFSMISKTIRNHEDAVAKAAAANPGPAIPAQVAVAGPTRQQGGGVDSTEAQANQSHPSSPPQWTHLKVSIPGSLHPHSQPKQPNDEPPSRTEPPSPCPQRMGPSNGPSPNSINTGTPRCSLESVCPSPSRATGPTVLHIRL